MSMNKAEGVTSLEATYLGCPTSCYVAVDYLRHLNDHTYVVFADVKFHFLKIGQALFQEWPQLLETQWPALSQIWSSFVFQHSTKRAEVWISNIHVNFW
jgi:hypothetical protein